MADYVTPVVFTLNGEYFGVDIACVQSIERDINYVVVPNSMPFISGIVNLRGEVIPLYSLKKKFNMDNSSKCDNAIVVSLPNVKIAIEVDNVENFSDISADNIVDMPMIVKQKDETEYLDRVAHVDGKLIILLDIVKILSDEEAESVREFADKMNEKGN